MPSPDSELVSESVKIDLSRAVKKMTYREEEIINMMFGLDNQASHSLHEIACLLNMSSEKVRQIKNDGLKKLEYLISGTNCFHNN